MTTCFGVRDGLCDRSDRTADSTWTAADIPDQSGRVAVITGANSGVGFATAHELARHGAHVVLAVRNPYKGQAAAAAIRTAIPNADVMVQHLNLASLESVERAGAELGGRFDRIDLLINNAGVMGGARSTTVDGFEMHLGVNHLGHFALTGTLIGHLLAAPNSRIVTVSSAAHRLRARIRFDDLHSQRRYTVNRAYLQSKLANLLFTYQLQHRLNACDSSTIAVAAHPGGSTSDITRHSTTPVRLVNQLLQSPAMGALPTLRAATDPSVSGGQFYGPRGFLQMCGYPKVVRSSSHSLDLHLQRRIWTLSEELTGIDYPAF
ncbi:MULTISPECIES: oxidoreductase [unclassified Mycobacterium]|uniref:oxidoreductase n=1 Tax=unclassified Mycobacterium TaxID=2642494 RepID=UPI0029C6BB0A|nr:MULTISPECIES: oxidoreductase [unclassified Mycobacterium]